MSDLPPSPTPNDDASAEPDHASATGMPRWVKVSLIIAFVLVLAFVILNLIGAGGGHGPTRHIGGLGVQTVPSSVIGIPNHGR